MKKNVLLILVLTLCVSLFSGPVSFERAQIAAENWVGHLRTTFNEPVTLASGESIFREGTIVAYIFHLHPRGYIMISTEDYLPPVKIYSLKNNFGKEGKKLEELIFRQYADIIEKVNSSEIDPGEWFNERNKRDFEHLTRVSGSSAGLFTGDPPDAEQPPYQPDLSRVREVLPLVATTWNQREPYNLKCPMVNGERCVTGCVATAFAQIMKYYEYPAAGRYSRIYVTDTHQILIQASFEHPYYWDRMLNAYPEPDTGTAEQRDAISQLMFDIGASLNMNYAPNGSGAESAWAVSSFPVFFDYSREMLNVYRRGWDDAGWFQLAKDQVDAGLPVGFGISSAEGGHMVVIDGYRISNGAQSFHINMGWGGSYDAYYSLNNIVVTDKNLSSTPEKQGYILNMIPSGRESELPPMSIGASAHLNRSLLQREYYCELTWQGIPGVNNDIDHYEIIRLNGMTSAQTVLANVNHTGQAEPYRHIFRLPEYSPDLYTVSCVNHSGVKWKLLFCSLILRE